jgi:Protein of unknown function (DUF1475)
MLFQNGQRKTEMNTLLIPVLRALLALAALVLTAAIIWALGRASLFDSFGKIIADPWGIVTLIDLYSGFLAISVVIAIAEPRRAVTASVIMLTPFLGSVVPLAWLIIRLPMLIDRMTPHALSPSLH